MTETPDDDPMAGVRLVYDSEGEVRPPLPAEPPAGAMSGPPPGPPAETGGGGSSRPRDTLPPDALPEDCVVEPLGVAGDKYLFLDQLRQIRIYPAKELGQANITSLFGTNADQLWNAWGRFDKNGECTGIHANMAARALMHHCALRGVYDIADRVRGRGAWLGEDAQLVIHAGDAVWMGSEGGWRAPGVYGRHVYPAAPPLPRHLANAAAAGDDGPAGMLLETLLTWHWRRGELDAWLLLGWIGAAMIGGALKHRPLVWITGDKATGKSTLHELIRGVFDGAILSAADVTAAGLWQRLGHDALPVAVDELEAEVDNHRSDAVIKLARNAATGSVILRGGADHKGQEFTARSCFLFSSILLPSLLPQDRSRLAILDLKPLLTGDPPDLDPGRLGGLGAQLRRRMLDAWPRFGATLERYRFALAKEGHGGRGADQFGTLLACADCLMFDRETDAVYAAGWASRLPAATETSDAIADHESCLARLLGSHADPRGTGDTVGELLAKASHRDDDPGDGGEWNPAPAARRKLEQNGIKYLESPWDGFTGEWVAIANASVGLDRIFAGTHWAGRSGAAGVWSQSLQRVEGAQKSPKVIRFAGVTSRAVVLPLHVMLGDE